MTSENEADDGISIVSSVTVTSENDWSDLDDQHEMNYSIYSNTFSLSTSFQNTTAVNGSSISHISLDHSYCTSLSNDAEQTETPKRQKKCDDYQSSSIATPSAKVNKSPQIIISKDSKPTISTTPQSPILRSPRPKARFLKHFRSRSSS